MTNRRITILKNLAVFLSLISLSLFLCSSLGEAEAFPSYQHSKEEILCITNALHFEAGNQSSRGQRAVFDVIENRSRLWSKGYCQVIKQKNQFSFYPRKWKKSLDSEDWKIYYDVVVARDRVLNEDVMWYHSDYVQPVWSKKLVKDRKIGNHIFYKQRSEM